MGRAATFLFLSCYLSFCHPFFCFFSENNTEGGGGGGGSTEDATVDYRLYQSFWRLQNYALKQDHIVKGGRAASLWKTLMEDVDQVIILSCVCVFRHFFWLKLPL